MRQTKIMMSMAVVVSMCSLFMITAHVSASDTTTVRVISTADLHSQVSSADYEVAGINRTASLAKLSTMIKSAREEITEGTSITVDAGDSIYGYGAEYIKSQNINTVQPIYEGMSKIGYDAIVLGNHDFDFGFDYIQRQLNLSGLSKVCLVSNVIKNSDGKAPWAGTKMITRKVTTAQGKQVQIKIGIVGATRPTLSNIYDYDGTLVTSGIISSVKSNAAALKKAGANVVVAVVHAGMGDEKSTDADSDVAYALSKLSDVDCIMTGHAHRNFPSTDGNVQNYYHLPNVDATTGLMNGKPVVMSADHGKAIGICDLTLSINGSTIRVAGAKPSVRRSTVKIEADPAIESITKKYDDGIQKQYKAILASLREGDRVTGYFTLLEDNSAIQLNNEAKIRFGMQYQSTREGKAYASYPVISATQIYMDGSEGAEDYFDISGNITWGDLMNVQRYDHNWNYIYWLTGAQLKEWLEWSASIYAQSGERFTNDGVLNSLSVSKGITSLLSNGWSGSFGQYAIFNGIDYDIDISGPAKYDSSGHVINAGANRIKNLTCNGVAIANNSKFLMVCNEITASNLVLSALTNQRLVKKSEKNTVDYFKDYVQELNRYSPITDVADHNWKLTSSAGLRIIRTSPLADSLAQIRSWYQGTLFLGSDYGYYAADLSQVEEDLYGPLLVLAPSTTETTNESVTIKVRTEDYSKVASCSYLMGNYDANSTKWSQSTAVKNGQVAVSINGEYTFRAIDTKGNVTIKHIKISNINPNVLTAPEVNTPVNKKTVVTGYAKAGLTVHITVSGKNYSTTVKSNGTFTCDVGKHRAGTVVSVYVEDSRKRKSNVVKVAFDRTGPNPPTLEAVTNKTTKLKGSIGETCVTMIAYVGSKYVYVPKGGGAAIYKKSKKYDAKRQIIETTTKLSNGKYSIVIPNVNAGVSVKVFAIDLKNRVSIVATRTVKKAAPNKPTVNTICDAENAVTGKIPSTKKACKVTVKVSGKNYTAKSKKNGKFQVETPKLKSGMTVSVYASDTSKGKKRKSASTSCKVTSKKKYTAKKNIVVKAITSKTMQIKGSAKKGTELYLNYGSAYTKLDLNKNGTFYYTLPHALKGGQTIYFIDRNKDGTIVAVKQVKVKAVKPMKPQIQQTTVTTRTKRMMVLSKEDATLVVKLGNKTIKIKKNKYSKTKKAYVYTVKLPKSAVAQRIVCYMKNISGAGAKATMIRRKV